MARVMMTLLFFSLHEMKGSSLSSRISTWADKSKNIVNAVIEITKNTRPKMEVATKETLNPIKQDMKKGKLRDYPLDIFWNYGGFSAQRTAPHHPRIPHSDSSTIDHNPTPLFHKLPSSKQRNGPSSPRTPHWASCNAALLTLRSSRWTPHAPTRHDPQDMGEPGRGAPRAQGSWPTHPATTTTTATLPLLLLDLDHVMIDLDM